MIEISSDISNEDQDIRENYEKKILTDINYAKHLKTRGHIYLKISPNADPKDVAKVIEKTVPRLSPEPFFVIEVDMLTKEETR